jgi:hypothetical protein
MIYIKRLFSFLGLIVILIISIVLTYITVLALPILIIYFYVRYGNEADAWKLTKIGYNIFSWYIDKFM